MEKKTNKNKENKEKLADAKEKNQAPISKDKRQIKTHGRIFQGKVITKFDKRVAIEFERMIFVRKYERYAKAKTKLHARLPESMKEEVKVGDLIRIQECRPLSKIIHFMVIEKVNNGNRENIKAGENKQ